jgi:nicotinamide-nucleotide amidase
MHAEVIERLDTNSQWLSQRLGELGIAVRFHTTVADDLEANVLVFRQAVERADIVIATGGLGPTADDLTREALAQVLGVELVLDEASLTHIRALFARRKRDMPERNVVQAMFPRGSRAIPNPEGTAPGVAAEIPRLGSLAAAHLFALPGVPDEMQEMWQQTVAPAIRGLGGGAQVIRHRRIKCFGVGESDLEQMLPDIIRRGRVPQVGITVSGATITLRITASGSDEAECHEAMLPTIATIHQCLGNLVFGDEDDELEHAVARLLAARDGTLSTVEWGTGGLIADRLGDVPEAKGRYLGGLVIPSERSLVESLRVAADMVRDCGPKSPQVTQAMAQRCRELFGTDYALAIGDFPEYLPEASEPGQFHYALASPAGVEVKSTHFAGHPSILKIRAAKQALNLLRLRLLAG